MKRTINKAEKLVMVIKDRRISITKWKRKKAERKEDEKEKEEQEKEKRSTKVINVDKREEDECMQ